jgi:hypothetical protein
VPSLDAMWRKSSRSGQNGSCIEVRRLSDIIEVRDTKDRSGPVLSFSALAWRDFVAAVNDGEFMSADRA